MFTWPVVQVRPRDDKVRRYLAITTSTTETAQCTQLLPCYVQNGSIELNQLPEKLGRKLPKHPVPAALTGRLAVCDVAQGQGVGKMLLADAIKRTLAVSDQIEICAIVVDTFNQNAKGFYEQYGFTRLSDDSSRLFLPL